MEKEKTIEYTDGEITVVWKPGKCKHAGNCVRNLPDVYKPKERPWVKTEAFNKDEIIAQMKTCPSGALSFYLNK